MAFSAVRQARTTARLVLGVAVASLVPIVAFLAVATFAGWRLLAVSSGSMEPTFPVGSLAVVHAVDVGDIGPGTVIAFVDGAGGEGRLVAHRVVEVVDRPSGRWLRTQGDANRTPDSQLLSARDVRGRVAWVVPRLGSVARTIGGRGTVVLVALAVISLLPRPTRIDSARSPRTSG
ncbi:MAG: signal peptidase I [Acidimicrobiales bacterium]